MQYIFYDELYQLPSLIADGLFSLNRSYPWKHNLKKIYLEITALLLKYQFMWGETVQLTSSAQQQCAAGTITE